MVERKSQKRNGAKKGKSKDNDNDFIDDSFRSNAREDAGLKNESAQSDAFNNDAFGDGSEEEDDLGEYALEDDVFQDDIFDDGTLGVYDEGIDESEEPDIDLPVFGQPELQVKQIKRRLAESTRQHGRGFTRDSKGNAVPNRCTLRDIYEGGLRFLTANHNSTSTLSNGVVVSIPELFNYQQMTIATRTLKIETGKASQQAPHDFPGVRRTLDYIFDEPIKPGPTLRCTIKFVQGFKEDRLSDIEIAKMMLKENEGQKSTAPYAWTSSGEVRPEYRQVLKKHMDEIGATDADKKKASPRGFDYNWTPEMIEGATQQRTEQLADRWVISLIVPFGYKPRFRCRECGQIVQNKKQGEHLRDVKHEARDPGFEQVPDPKNTLQLTISRGLHKQGYEFSLPAEHYPEKRIVEEIANGLVDFYCRLPCPFHENMKMTALALVCKRVYDKHAEITPGSSSPVVNPCPVGYQKPYFYMRPDKLQFGIDPQSVGIDIYLFDPKTLLPYKLDPWFQPSVMPKHVEIPEVPDYIIWTYRQRARIGLRAVPDSSPDEKLNKAVRLAKFISFKLYGKVVTKPAALQLIEYYRNFYENAPLRFEGFERRHSLFNTSVHESIGIAKVLPHVRLRRMVHGKLPQVLVHTTDRDVVVAILDQGLNAFLLDGNPLSTWMALCQAADTVNDEVRSGGMGPTLLCSCTTTMRTHTLHHCPGCFRIETCIDMDRTSDNSDVKPRCRRCLEDRRVYSPIVVTRTYLRTTMKQELYSVYHPILGLDENARAMVTESLTNRETPFLEEEAWKFWDRYTDAKPLPVVPPTTKSRSIMGFSTDAVFPYFQYRLTNGKLTHGIHCSPNLRVTTLGHNFAKGVNLIGTLHLAAVCWSFSQPGVNSDLPVDELYRCLLQQADDMHLVRLQTPHSTVGRMKLPLDEKEFAKTKEEWILSAPLTKARREQYKRSQNFVFYVRPPREWNGKPKDWDHKTYPTLLEMESRWDQKLPRGKDGCPFPGHPSAMPKDWSFWTCRMFFTDRTCRMWYYCNGLWPQLDTADTLFLSCCLQFLDPSRREWLNLPWSFYPSHPLRLSFGHTVHGKMLRSGWTVPFPSSLSQYNESIDNLEVETSLSNCLKNNATESDCAKAKNHLLSISLPKELYRPRKLLRPHHRKGPQYEPWSIDAAPGTEGSPKSSSSKLGPLDETASKSSPKSSPGKSGIDFTTTGGFQTSPRNNPELIETTVSRSTQESSVANEFDAIGLGLGISNGSHSTRYRGIKNFGHFCWMNSTVQFLYTIDPLRQAILVLDSDNFEGSSEVDLARHDMILELWRVFRDLDIRTDSPIDPRPLMGSLIALRRALNLPAWTGSRSEDVHEVIVWLLQQLWNESSLSPTLSSLTQQSVELVTKSCPQCAQPGTSQSIQPLEDQSIFTVWLSEETAASLPSRDEFLAVLIAKAFEAQTAQYTEACPLRINGHGVREAELRLSHFPEYFLVHISRTGRNQVRIDTRIIGTEELDLASVYKPPSDTRLDSYYELCSEIRHEGVSAEDGHYFTYSRIQHATWLKFNDGHVSSVTPFEDLHGRASMLLYKRANRPTQQDGMREDEGAGPALEAFKTELEYQEKIVNLFYQRDNEDGVTLEKLLSTAYDEDHDVELDSWQSALNEVAFRVGQDQEVSVWTLRLSHTLNHETVTGGRERVVAILSKSSSNELGTICHWVRYRLDRPDSQAYVSWGPQKTFLAKSIARPLRRMIDEVESGSKDWEADAETIEEVADNEE